MNLAKAANYIKRFGPAHGCACFIKSSVIYRSTPQRLGATVCLALRRFTSEMTDPRGHTAALMRAAGIDSIIRLDSVNEIQAGLMKFIDQIHCGRAPIPTFETITKYSRKQGSKDLGGILDVLVNLQRT
jgi:hypothetical protein